MATVTELTTLQNGQVADADDVMANFNVLRTFAQTKTVHSDGAVHMTGQLWLPSANPTETRHATHKGYVDGAISTAQSTLNTTITNRTSGPYVHATSWASGDYSIDGTDEQTFEAATWANITFDHEVADTTNSYNLATGAFNAPKAGLYMVSLTVGGGADEYMSTRIMVGDNLETAACYFGPRWDPSTTKGTGPANAPSPMSFSHVVQVAAADTLIRPQFHPESAGTFRFGKTLTIAFLHP